MDKRFIAEKIMTLLISLIVWKMELLHQKFPPWYIYLDVFLFGVGLFVYLRITKKINTKKNEMLAMWTIMSD